MKSDSTNTALNFSFWLHLFVNVLAWAGPFLFSWQLMLAAYILVQIQFSFLGKCLMNEHHDLSEEDDYTFNAYLLETMGFDVNRKLVKRIVRGGLYIFFGIFAWFWQSYLGNEALLF